MSVTEKNFVICEKCGKRLIERTPNGLWHFCFGRDPNGMSGPPVDIWVHGSLKMKCLRRSCQHINTLNYFPFNGEQV